MDNVGAKLGIVLVFILGASAVLSAQVRIGQIAPRLEFAGLVQGELGDGGPRKARLVEFWATTCVYCVKNIPHLNELAAAFEQRGVDFISVTAEERSTVERFLRSHPIRGVVALDDPKGRMFQAYGAGLPTTALIDRAGRVVRVVDPSQITATVLDDLVSDRPVQLPAAGMTLAMNGAPMGTSEQIRKADAPSPDGWISTTVKMSIAPSTERPEESNRFFVECQMSTYPWFSASTIDGKSTCNHIRAEGATLPDLLSFAYDLSEYQVQVSKYFQGGKYAVEGWVPVEYGKLMKPMLRLGLEAAIGYSPRVEKRRLDVLVLKGLPGRLRVSNADQATDTCTFKKDSRGCDGRDLAALRSQIEDVVGRRVVVDDALPGKFAWEVHWDPSKAGTFQSALRDQLGLDLRAEQRWLEFLTIEPRDQ
jgi:uncharacterized protein (TIGR03435 family)